VEAAETLTPAQRLLDRLRPLAQPITAVLLGGLVLQLVTAMLQGHGADLFVFTSWSRDLARRGPWDFYDSDYVAEYFPGYLYLLTVLGLIDKELTFSQDQWEYILKIPSVLANVWSAYLLYILLDGRRQIVRLAAPVIYLVLPTTLFIGPVWGQIDSVIALGLLLSVYYLGGGRPLLGALVFVITFMIKPQSVGAAPVLIFWGLRNYPREVWLKCAGVAVVAALALIIPFFPTDPWRIFDQVEKANDLYPFNSSFAMNFWGMWGWFRGDDIKHLGIEWRTWGYILTVLANVTIIAVLRNRREVGMLALGVGMSMLVFDLFMTRMHERYLFPAFLPLLAATFLLNSRVLALGFVVLSVVQFLSLYYAFYYPTFNPEFEPSWFYTHDIIRMIEYSPKSWSRPGTLVIFLCSLSAIVTYLVYLGWAAWADWRLRAAPPSSGGETS
jgi:Gpi18-like mannosyltransferase